MQHRRAAGLSLEELADLAGVSADGVAALERGRRRAPRPLTVRLLADALDLDEDRRRELVAAARDQTTTNGHHRPPAPTDALFGRDRELTAAAAALGPGGTRLLTLAGPGGVGKTRLALALAQALRDRFAEQYWVPLDALPPGADVTGAVGAALGVLPAPAPGQWEPVAARVADRTVLLVLDNCEHVLTSSARLVTSLLPLGHGLHVLATSREPLHVAGESVHRIGPLDLPDAGAAPERAREASAVQLFLARSAYPVADERLTDVIRLCRRLDGLALAIELAAARTNVLTVAQIADELDRSVGVLTDAARSAPRRQRALEATIAWSHDLLTAEEQHLFAAASVFRGGWSLSSAHAVCGESDRVGALDLISRLADKSLVQVHHDGEEARYDMFVVVREFADRRLTDSGRREGVERRFVEYFADLAGRADEGLLGVDHVRWLRRLDAELDNLRQAMVVTGRHAWAGHALRISGGLSRYFYLRGRYGEGRGHLEAALALDDGTRAALSAARARALTGAGYLAFLQCEYAAAADLLERALHLYRAAGDRAGAALVLRGLGGVARERADYELADTLHRESLDLCREPPEPSGTAWAHHHLGFVGWLRGDLGSAAAHAATAREAFERLGDQEGLVWSRISLGAIARLGGDLATAAVQLTAALDQARRLAYREGIAWALEQLGVLAHAQGRPEQAIHRLEDSFAVHEELGDRWRMASVLEGLAGVVHDRGRADHAARLLAAADGLRSRIGAPVPPAERTARDRLLTLVRRSLGPVAFAEATAAGHAGPVRDVVEGSLGR